MKGPVLYTHLTNFITDLSLYPIQQPITVLTPQKLHVLIGLDFTLENEGYD